MMQTVNVSLMKATVQDMQTYLHHLERLLGMDLPHRMNLCANLHQSVSYNMEQPQNEQSVLVTHLERLSHSIHGLDRKIDSHMTAISELSNRIAQVEESQQELLAQSNNIPSINMNNGYQYDSPLLSATITDDCTLLSADAIFSSDSMQSITVCKMDVPVNEIIIPSVAIEPIQNAVVVEAPVVAKASIAEAPKVIEVPVVAKASIAEAPKVIDVPVVAKASIAEAPKVIEVPVVEAPKVEVLSVESSQEANGDQKVNDEEEQEADGEEVEEVEEEEEQEEQEAEEITYNGETYYKDADGFIYKPEDDTPIGYWKEKTQSIAFYRAKK